MHDILAEVPRVLLILAISAAIGVGVMLPSAVIERWHRRELLRQGWKDVGTVFIVALILDAIYQLIVHSGIYTLELLLTATILALVPYALLRGLVTRLARRRSAVTPTEGQPGDQGKRSEDQQQERKED